MITLDTWAPGPRKVLHLLVLLVPGLCAGAGEWYRETTIKLPTRSHVSSVCFSGDGCHIAATSGTAVHVYKISDGSEQKRIRPGKRLVVDASFSPNGKRIAISDYTGMVYVCNVATSEVQQKFRAHKNSFAAEQCSVEFSEDGDQLLTAGEDNAVRVWNAETAKRLIQIETKEEGGTQRTCFSADGRWLLVLAKKGTVSIYERSGKLSFRLKSSPELNIMSATLSPDGALLALGLWRQEVRVWRTADRHELARFKTAGGACSLAFSPDGSLLLTAEHQQNAAVWNVKTGALISKVGIWHTDGILRSYEHSEPAFSADGNRIASALAGEIQIWARKSKASRSKKQ